MNPLKTIQEREGLDVSSKTIQEREGLDESSKNHTGERGAR